MRLVDVATIKTDFNEANFWLVRRGSIKTVGSVKREFSPYHIGIKIHQVDILLPDYLYYCLMHLHQTGHWENLSHGTLSLVNIRVSDVKRIILSPS